MDEPLSRDTYGDDTTGTLDEALERLHATGPERDGWLSNHAPMAVEALVRHGQAPTVHRWLDHYRNKLEDMPGTASPVTAENWPEALGDPRRIADWAAYFERETTERPWGTSWPSGGRGCCPGSRRAPPIRRSGSAMPCAPCSAVRRASPGSPSRPTASATGRPGISRCPH